jgi:hypothetical protein|tara:strand:+ start:35 stop:325 length:291 start_codon:yes stop_codon:yes gene_type:complete
LCDIGALWYLHATQEKKMSKRFSVVQAKEVQGRDKPVWLRHGIAFEKDGKGISIKLESLPLPNKDGEIWLRLFEDDGSRSQQNNSGGSSMDDAIPF